MLVFHYSGHGQQITDDNGDEPDGYDETIVPYDAPMRAEAGYRGDKHLRDDELARKLLALRAKVGPTGNVVFAFDSCFSGAISVCFATNDATPVYVYYHVLLER